MTLDQISNLSQTIAAIGVVISLWYAALQFRMYAKAAREARLVASSSDIQEFRRILATDTECARVFYDGMADFDKLTPTDKRRFDALMQMIVTQVIYLSKFQDVPAEVVPEMIFGRGGVRQWWGHARIGYAAHVVKLMDGVFTVSATREPKIRSIE